jgi:hypothetical protein
VLLVLVFYLTFINFLLNGPLSLDIPYLLLKTSSEKLAGSLMALMSLGAFSGATWIAVRGKVRHKVVTMLLGLLVSGIMFLVLGTGNQPWILGISLFIIMVPLPIMNTLIISLLQVKTPPDMQGRIFAVFSQMGYLGSTASFLITGWLVDHWLEPAVNKPGWTLWVPLVGDQPGAGMGLLLVITGVFMILATVVMLAARPIRTIEQTLPDYGTEIEN